MDSSGVDPLDVKNIQNSDPVISMVITCLQEDRRPNQRVLRQESMEFRRLIREWNNLKSGRLYIESDRKVNKNWNS